MATRKHCSSCKKNFGKSAYYMHLPCVLEEQRGPVVCNATEYVFCKHCNKRVAKKTYDEHQRLLNVSITSMYSSGALNTQTSVFDSVDIELDSNNDGIPSSDNVKEFIDEEVQEQEEEDQTFYSDLSDVYTEGESSGSDKENDSQINSENRRDNDVQDVEEEEILEDDVQGEPEKNSSHTDNNISAESKAFVLFLLLWQILYKVSDNGISVLLKFFRQFLIAIGSISGCDVLVNFAETLPGTLYMAKIKLGLEKDDFEKFAACPKCMKLYKLEECTYTKTNGSVSSKRCSHVKYPNHPQRRRRTECGAFLMKKMRSKSGSVYLQPKRMYCFRSPISSLKTLLSKPGFFDNCEDWRKRNLDEGKMGDVYEGKLWKDFLDINGKPYFSSKGNLGVMLNVDWFQPFKHTQYSCGVIYLVLMNLPRHERFKLENVIIVGIIPGPDEPKGNINSFLQPLVDELMDLWDGINVKSSKGSMLKIRVALLALCCDIPAARKCGGFAGHTALRGCNKCFKTFPRDGPFGTKPDFSGFNVDEWEKRTNALHRIHAERARAAKSPAKLKEVIHDTGARYTALLELPYYDAIRFVVIDPMHNLFLGIAKTTMKVWKETGALNDKDLEIIQKRVNAVEPPSEIGRIPSKIATGFGGFTADQWKNWVCYYSLFALKGILPKRDYNVWLHFVNACRAICCHTLNKADCIRARKELIEFCKAFKCLYGKDTCTPNMHLSCHIVDCIEDYGPVYSFWCFSFERYNGVLGSYHKSSQNIGIQLMRRFLKDLQLKQMEWPDNFQVFGELLETNDVGTVGDMSKCDLGDVVCLPPIKRISLDRIDINYLFEFYEKKYEKVEKVLRISEEFKEAQVHGRVIKSSSNVGVYVRSANNCLKPVKVVRFLNNECIILKDRKKKKVNNAMVEVEYFKEHPQKNWYAEPLEVWSTDVECRQFVSMSSISGQFMRVIYRVKFPYGIETVQVVIPLIGRFC